MYEPGDCSVGIVKGKAWLVSLLVSAWPSWLCHLQALTGEPSYLKLFLQLEENLLFDSCGSPEAMAVNVQVPEKQIQ